MQIEDFFHPDAGYQVNVLSKYLVRHGHDVTVLCAKNLDIFPDASTSFFGIDDIEQRDRAYEQQYGVRIKRIHARGYYSGRTFYSSELYKTVVALNPDLLFVHGNDSVSGMHYTMKSKSLSFPVVFDSHMLSIATRNPLAKWYRCLYKAVFANRINRAGLKVIRVQDDPYVIDELGVLPENAPYLGFGTDTVLFRPDSAARAQFRAGHDIPQDSIVVLYAGKLDKSKGGDLLAEAVCEEFPASVVFVIAGNPSGSEAGQTEKRFSESKNRIIRLPTHKYPQLPPLYQAADLAVYPAQCSLSFYDVQACGLPVLVDDSTPVNVDRVAHGNGWLFKQGQAESLREGIAAYCSMSVAARAAASNNALAYINEAYSYERVSLEYEALFEQIVSDFKSSGGKQHG